MDAAASLVKSGDTVLTGGFLSCGVMEGLFKALEKRFLDTGTPADLTLVAGTLMGDGTRAAQAHQRMAHDGMVTKLVCGHFGNCPLFVEKVIANEILAFNVPLGVLSHMMRATAAGLPATATQVGLGTFVDPREDGGKMNELTKKEGEDMVAVQTVFGQELLFYKNLSYNIALLRGTTADPHGNVTMEREGVYGDVLAQAMAVKACGGIVIVQVERLAEHGFLKPREVRIPSSLVDAVVVAETDDHRQTFVPPFYDPAIAHELVVPLGSRPKFPLCDRKIIARRAAFELPIPGSINLGVGMPEGVADVASEEGVLQYMTLSTEAGVIGGALNKGLAFGTGVNSDALIDMASQFDYYDGGGLDISFLGMAQADAFGNVNVSRYGSKLPGTGGFVNISQNTRQIGFVGTFTARGLKTEIKDGKLVILQEGKEKKFVSNVEQITFSGANSIRRGQRAMYITERAVFELTPEGMVLTEIAPGIDLEKDVLGQMDFKPLIASPLGTMNPKIFVDEEMKLKDYLIDLPLEDRVYWDEEGETMHINFAALHVLTLEDICAIEDVLTRHMQAIRDQGRLWIDVNVNYDHFFISYYLSDVYIRLADRLASKFGLRVTRYTTSAFLSQKLGKALKTRPIPPHLFETSKEAKDKKAKA